MFFRRVFSKNIPLAVGALVLFIGPSLLAQGVQTGTLTGTVLTADESPLPGTTVSVASPALQG